MKLNTLFISLAALAGSLLAGPAETLAQVNLKSISVGASYWKPSLDYWNERSGLLDYNAGKGATFSGAVMPSAAIEVGLTKGLSVGGRVGYWKSSVAGDVTTGGITRSETLDLSIIPVSLDLKYTFAPSAPSSTTATATDEPKTPFLTPYIGLSVARYFISNDFSRQVTGASGSLSETQAGSNTGLQVFVGAEKKLVKKLFLALDVRYHLGSYNQVVRTETSSTTEKVSLSGLEAGLSLKFKLN
ncbi:hypothetical protein [Spirosoma utsteinense]|uniref:Opacity protein-like surface antigen n=1 Tax=Spirosoma utsteinense TaxID=2585773 RepID=A0ABR6WFR8_9BACT|nr:hypothetical protein [Spirosoma utsteinense]MBC3789121.1 opacity protein-like surface antigen [Spirosoma utsteinense]MBC3795013.1 opacity protein-like surface antigen [Spirosoma utsteinense]